MEQYTAEKNNDILKFAGKWMDLENIILSEVTQTQKDRYHMYSFLSVFGQKVKQNQPTIYIPRESRQQ